MCKLFTPCAKSSLVHLTGLVTKFLLQAKDEMVLFQVVDIAFCQRSFL